MVFKLIAVPEEHVLGDGQGTSAMVATNGPYEVVNDRNVAMLMASVEEVAVPRTALAVALQYLHHLGKDVPDVELSNALAELDGRLSG